VYVGWFDRKGAILSTGLNFVQNLPYFLVLLLAFQRFKSEDWGVVPQFSATNTNEGHFTFPSSPNASLLKAIVNQDKLYDFYGLIGRGTQVVSARSDARDPRNNRDSLGGKELALKAYWPEESRDSEEKLISLAKKCGEKHKEVEGHIPDVIRSADFPEFSTKHVRDALGLESKDQRVFRVMLVRRMYPITDLFGEPFWNAFWECFRCE
jgi:Fungal protein kinase